MFANKSLTVRGGAELFLKLARSVSALFSAGLDSTVVAMIRPIQDRAHYLDVAARNKRADFQFS